MKQLMIMTMGLFLMIGSVGANAATVTLRQGVDGYIGNEEVTIEYNSPNGSGYYDWIGTRRINPNSGTYHLLVYWSLPRYFAGVDKARPGPEQNRNHGEIH